MLNKVIRFKVQEVWNSNNKVEWKPSGYWASNDLFMNKPFATLLIKTINHVQQSKYTINNNDVIYASPVSEIPRFKLKEFIKENKIKKTTRINYADVIIINKGYFNELSKICNIQKYSFFKESFIGTLLNEIKKDNGYAANQARTLINNAKDKNTIALMDCQDYYGKDQLPKLLRKHPKVAQDIDNHTYIAEGIFFDLYRDQRKTNLINTLINRAHDILSGKCNVVFDEDLFIELNKEGIELDDDYEDTLRDMLFSEDKSNVKLGFEMMSNLVLSQSTLLSISFLLNEMFHTKGFRPSQYTSNTNLKSLFRLLKTKGIYWEKDWKTFGTGLRLNFKEGKEGIIVKKFLLDNINREFKLSNSASEALVDIVFTTEAPELTLA